MAVNMDRINNGAAFMINPALQVFRGSDNEIIVRFGSRGRSSRRIADDTKRGVLADFVTCFARGASYADAKEHFADHDVEDLFHGLIEHGVLIESDKARYAFLAAGLGSTPPETAAEHISVVGSGAIAEAVVPMLQEVLAETVEVGQSPHIDVHSDADLIVCVSDTPNLPLFFDVNEFAMSNDIRWHAAYADGPELVVGPLYVPGMTGCFHDFDILDEAGRSMRVGHLYGKMGTPLNGAQRLPTFVAGMAASYLSASVIQDLIGSGSFLEGHFLRIDLDRMEIVRQQLSRLARCPACIEARPDLRHPFL